MFAYTQLEQHSDITVTQILYNILCATINLIFVFLLMKLKQNYFYRK